MEPLRLEFTVACPPERAFALWAEQTARWWPHGHSVSGEPGLSVTSSRAAASTSARRPAREHDWGEVLVWEPPIGSSTSGTCASTAATRPRSR